MSYCVGGFKLLKSGRSGALCRSSSTAKKHEGSIWNGQSTGLADCRSKCDSYWSCKFFSFWEGGHCQLDTLCDHWGSDGNNMISTYARAGNLVHICAVQLQTHVCFDFIRFCFLRVHVKCRDAECLTVIPSTATIALVTVLKISPSRDVSGRFNKECEGTVFMDDAPGVALVLSKNKDNKCWHGGDFSNSGFTIQVSVNGTKYYIYNTHTFIHDILRPQCKQKRYLYRVLLVTISQ